MKIKLRIFKKIAIREIFIPWKKGHYGSSLYTLWQDLALNFNGFMQLLVRTYSSPTLSTQTVHELWGPIRRCTLDIQAWNCSRYFTRSRWTIWSEPNFRIPLWRSVQFPEFGLRTANAGCVHRLYQCGSSSSLLYTRCTSVQPLMALQQVVAKSLKWTAFLYTHCKEL